jgi:hypothetical protein
MPREIPPGSSASVRSHRDGRWIGPVGNGWWLTKRFPPGLPILVHCGFRESPVLHLHQDYPVTATSNADVTISPRTRT